MVATRCTKRLRLIDPSHQPRTILLKSRSLPVDHTLRGYRKGEDCPFSLVSHDFYAASESDGREKKKKRYPAEIEKLKSSFVQSPSAGWPAPEFSRGGELNFQGWHSVSWRGHTHLNWASRSPGEFYVVWVGFRSCFSAHKSFRTASSKGDFMIVLYFCGSWLKKALNIATSP